MDGIMAHEDDIMVVIVPPPTEHNSVIDRSSEKDEDLTPLLMSMTTLQCEKTAEVCMYVCMYVCRYLNVGPLAPERNHASRSTGHTGQGHTVFATYSSEGTIPIHARFAISELLYNY